MRKEDHSELLGTHVRIESENLPENALFQRDGASTHTCHDARERLKNIFGENRIGKYGPENWPAGSPDLTPPEFFVRGSVKYMVFKTSVNNLTQLKRIITRAIRSVMQEMIGRGWKN